MNRWAFLGNGWSVRHYAGRDITWFWGTVDGKDKKEEYELNWKASKVQANGQQEQVEQTVQDHVISPNAL